MSFEDLNRLKGLLKKELKEIPENFFLPNLKRNGETFVLWGNLRFKIDYKGKEIKDDYDIEITIPSDYPNTVPMTKEVGGKIPTDFHKLVDDSLCLGVPIDVKIKFAQHPNLMGYLEQVVHYLLAFSYKQKYGDFPFGDRKHGFDGILDYYNEKFGTDDLVSLKILCLLVYKNSLVPISCPCGSKKPLQNCHGPIIKSFKNYHSIEEFYQELLGIISLFQKGRRNSGESAKNSLFYPVKITA